MLLPHAKAHPTQASALLRTWEDLSLAQQWSALEVIDLPECDCSVFRGQPKTKVRPRPPPFVGELRRGDPEGDNSQRLPSSSQWR